MACCFEVTIASHISRAEFLTIGGPGGDSPAPPPSHTAPFVGSVAERSQLRRVSGMHPATPPEAPMPFDGLETPFGPLAKFDHAISLIEIPGNWIKHSYRTPRGQFCLKEALNTLGIAEVFEPIILKTAEEVMEREFCCIESFNDHPLTAHGDVVAVLRRTRENIVSGKIAMPPPVPRRASPRWNEYHAPAGTGWKSALSKWLCWA
jgi:hypothetical protein